MKHVILIAAFAFALIACDDGAYGPPDAEIDCSHDADPPDARRHACVDQCQPPSLRCAPEGLQLCVRNRDGCGVWLPPEPCSGGDRCYRGVCRPQDCDPACDPGDVRCAGPAAVNVCLDAKCPHWSPAMDCSAGDVCVDGECVAN